MSATAEHLRAAMRWLCLAQDSQPDGGVSAGYTHLKGWSASFPETTGYLIPTFLNHYLTSSEADYERRALRMADWLVSIQNSDGSYSGDVVGTGGGPSVFNTGQILFGLLRMGEHTGRQCYLDAAVRAGRWLAATQAESGEWRRHDFLGKSHVYNTRTAWALLLTHTATGEEALREAGRRNIAWALSQADGDAFYARAAFDAGTRYGVRQRLRAIARGRNLPAFYTEASLHTIAYTIQGLLESAWLLGDENAESTATRSAERLADDVRAGRLAGFYAPGWRPVTSSVCLTGAAQMAIVWLRLANVRGRRDLVDAADAAIDLVAGSQSLAANRSGRRGAVPGSKPLWGLYLPFRYPNWAAKFTVDALHLRLEPGTRDSEPALQVW